MSKILGIDLGTNSIGLSCRDIEKAENLKDQLTYYSSVIFPSGVGTEQGVEFSYAAKRTKHRSARRLYQARKYRIWATLMVLIQNKLCPLSEEDWKRWAKYDKTKKLKRQYPVDVKEFEQWVRLDFDGDGIADYSSPYQLRAELMNRQFDFSNQTDRYKFGRAMYHIAQRRGFKSSKGETIKEQESSEKEGNEIDLSQALKKSEETKSGKLVEYMKEHKMPTVGCAFYELEKNGVRIRKSEYQAVRSQYKEEIKVIFDFQQGLDVNSDLYKHLLSEKKNEGTIFYKRPLRSQKGLVGKCTLEPTKPRCPISHPDFEKYRAWCLINNIKYRLSPNNEWESLSLELKNALFYDKFMLVRPSFKFEDIAKWISTKVGYEVSYKKKTLNYKGNTSVSGCPVSARLKALLGENWETAQIETNEVRKGKNGEHQKSYTAIDLWHICFTEGEGEKIVELAEKIGFSEEQTKKMIALFDSIQQGYANLSLKAIRNINRFLLHGFIYSEAAMLAKIPDLIGEENWKKNENSIITELRKKGEATKEQKVIITIVNNLIANYKTLAIEQQFAYRNTSYLLDDNDMLDISKCAEDVCGKDTWKKKLQEEQNFIVDNVAELYQQFFANEKRGYFSIPRVSDTFKEFLSKKFGDDKNWDKLYHPSMIEFYKPAIPNEQRLKLLDSPVIGALKNPMAMRVLHTLRKQINNLLNEGVIDEDTRIVVETARELNDANMRWAIESYNKTREEENKVYAVAIQQYYKNRVVTDDDIDKVRLLFDQKDILKRDEKYTPPKEKQQAETYKKDVTKYKLWIEQGGVSVYTGNVINLTNLFDEASCDIEHTIPRSLSFDSSLANLTICEAYINRAVKKNQIPAQLSNYEEILQRIQPWFDKVEHLKDNVNYWKAQSKRAQDKVKKDSCIRQRHLWELELNYWQDKVSRFTMKEVPSGFKHSQLNDTRIITKYAYHFLRSVFSMVDVQKGSITADFRKILGVQTVDEKKSRDKHSHHAIDATMLTLIPMAAKRDKMLELFYKIEEAKRNYADTTSERSELKRLIDSCEIGNHADEVKQYIEETILINHVSKDQALSPAHRKMRKRGKIVWKRDANGEIITDAKGNKVPERWLTGDCIRGQLHKDSFYGAITQAVKDEKGKILRDDNGNILLEKDEKTHTDKIYYVKRVDAKHKKGPKDSGFSNWEELEGVAVDKVLVQKIKNYYKGENGEIISFKEACEKGLYFLDKKGHVHGPVRHIRCKQSNIKNPLKIKQQTYLSEKEYKQYYYADMGDLYAMCKYESEDKTEKEFRIWSKFDISQNKKFGIEDIPMQIPSKKKNTLLLSQTLKVGNMLLLYKESKEELSSIDNISLNRSLYVIRGFENDGNRIVLQKHICALPDKILGKGKSIEDYNTMPEKIRCGINTLKYLVRGIDFEITPLGIKFKD